MAGACVGCRPDLKPLGFLVLGMYEEVGRLGNGRRSDWPGRERRCLVVGRCRDEPL